MNVFGFGQFEANRRQLRFQFIDQNGKVLDEFQMCSRPRCAPPPSLGASAPQGNASQARGPPPPPSPPPPPPLKTPPPPKPTSPPRPAPLTPPPSPPLRSPPATAPAKATPNGSQPVTAPQTSSVPSPSPQAPSWAWIWKPAQETKAQKNEALPTSAAAKHSPAVSPPPPVWTWEPKEPAGSQEKQALSPKETEQGPPPLLPSDTRQTNASSSPPPPPAGWAWTWKPGTARLGQQPSAPSKGPPKPDKEPASQAEPEPANRDRGVGANLPNGAGATTDAMPVGQVQPETPAGKSSSTAPQANRRQPSEPTANQEREEPGRARPLDTEADMTFAIEFPSLDISEFADSA